MGLILLKHAVLTEKCTRRRERVGKCGWLLKELKKKSTKTFLVWVFSITAVWLVTNSSDTHLGNKCFYCWEYWEQGNHLVPGVSLYLDMSCGSSSVLKFLPLSLTQKDWKEQRFCLQIYVVYNKIGKRNGKAQWGKQAFNKPNVHDGEMTVFHKLFCVLSASWKWM